MTETEKDTHFVKSNLPYVEYDDWMYQCLAEAKSMVKRYHTIDARGFFKNTTFEIFKGNNQVTFVDVSRITGSHFQIRINPPLWNNSFENQRDLVIVLIRALLSIIHVNSSEGKIIAMEKDMGVSGAYDAALNDLKEQAKNSQIDLVSFP